MSGFCFTENTTICDPPPRSPWSWGLRSGRWRDGYTGSCGNCREVMRGPKEDWGFLNEKAFEGALPASVPERLPDKVAAVTP